MLATSRGPFKDQSVLPGLQIWEPGENGKIISKIKNSVRRSPVVFTNIPYNPYETLHNMLFSYMGVPNSNYMSSAIYEFSEDDWKFLELASREYARLNRMSEVLPIFHNMIMNPDVIVGNFCALSRNNDYFKNFCSSMNGILPENALRYRLAMYTSVGGAVFSIFSESSEKQLAKILCAILFSRPYRKDWISCPLQEMEDDAEYLSTLFKKHSKDFNYTIWDREISKGYTGNFCKLYRLILNWPVLRQMQRIRTDSESDYPEYAEPVAHICFDDTSCWFNENASTYEVSRNIAPLPAKAMALKVNPISGAVVPMYPALDECELTIVLVPESKAVWDAMLRIYNMPTHDRLYPESPTVQMLLSPQGSYFVREMAERFNLIYLGLQSLGKYVDEIAELEKNGENPDYQFHAFVYGDDYD